MRQGRVTRPAGHGPRATAAPAEPTAPVTATVPVTAITLATARQYGHGVGVVGFMRQLWFTK